MGRIFVIPYISSVFSFLWVKQTTTTATKQITDQIRPLNKKTAPAINNLKGASWTQATEKVFAPCYCSFIMYIFYWRCINLAKSCNAHSVTKFVTIKVI